MSRCVYCSSLRPTLLIKTPRALWKPVTILLNFTSAEQLTDLRGWSIYAVDSPQRIKRAARSNLQSKHWIFIEVKKHRRFSQRLSSWFHVGANHCKASSAFPYTMFSAMHVKCAIERRVPAWYAVRLVDDALSVYVVRLVMLRRNLFLNVSGVILWHLQPTACARRIRPEVILMGIVGRFPVRMIKTNILVAEMCVPFCMTSRKCACIQKGVARVTCDMAVSWAPSEISCTTITTVKWCQSSSFDCR